MHAIKFLVAASCLTASVDYACAMDGRAHYVCEGDLHVVTISGWYYEEYIGPVDGIILKREAVGVCVASDFVPENGPLPLETFPNPEGGFPVYEIAVTIVPPLSDVTYRYTPFGVRPDGSLVPMFNYCSTDMRSYALATCGDAPFARGKVVVRSGSVLNFGIQLCTSECWTEWVGVYLNVALLEELVGEPWTDSNSSAVCNGNGIGKRGQFPGAYVVA